QDLSRNRSCRVQIRFRSRLCAHSRWRSVPAESIRRRRANGFTMDSNAEEPMHFQLMMKLAALGAMVFVSNAVADAGALHVRVTGFKSSDGALAIALFKNEADYESQTNAVERAWFDID